MGAYIISFFPSSLKWELLLVAGHLSSASQDMSASSSGQAVSKAREYVTTNIPPSYASDPKFKKYTQQVDKCLNSFDNVQEWADFISFLKQLLKTFQAYMQFKEIPRKLIVAKRLSQCLNPALPTGVHQRALDVYAHVLAVLGSEGLQRDLALWSSGLFPFFEYAATSVKPTLLNLFDTHYLPLQAGLRPIMKSFILALLPGLEEETGEFFEKVLGLLDRLSGTVAPSFFLQNMWLIMLTSPSARGTSLNFLSRQLPRLHANEDITAIVGRDIGLMIRAFAAALEDDDLLVRRSALDLLLQSLRIDSIAIKKASTEDQNILMRAATSVVLRRDLSLNRRIYSWLLGPDEHSQQQVAYLKTHALDLLASTLRDEMFHPSADYSQSRPFKIFISLLDKWEIGSALTEVLVLDAFKAIRIMIDSDADITEEMTMTASTLYEAVEPHALWKQLLKTIMTDVTSNTSSCDGINMVYHILSSYHKHDEEIETIHLPIVFTALLEAVDQLTLEDSARIPSPATHATLRLLLQMLKLIPASALKQRPQISRDAQAESLIQGPYAFASTFFGLDAAPLVRQSELTSPLASAFLDATSLTITVAKGLSGPPKDMSGNRQSLIDSLGLLNAIVDRVQQIRGTSLPISWQPEEWLSAILDCVQSKTAAFSVIDCGITSITHLQQNEGLEPTYSIDNRITMAAMINPLLKYLRPPYAAFHARAVSLIWQLEKSTKSSHLESLIAESISLPRKSEEVQEACEAFGVLWRLTDDSLMPGFRLRVPMMLVLDTLKSDNPNIRRVGETWMRCSLKSYPRVLEPLLSELHDPSVRRSNMIEEFNGRQIQGFYYERPFDQRYIAHLLETSLSIVKFGGQGFSKTARGTALSRSGNVDLIERLQIAGNFPDSSYMDIMIHLLLRFLQSEPKPGLSLTLHPLNIVIQSTSLDLLQALVVRGEVDAITLQTIESTVVSKLYFSVHTHRLDLQNKLLHLLHSIITALSSLAAGSKPDKTLAVDRSPEISPSSAVSAYNINSLLVQTLIDGLSASSNRSGLQHWLDFVLSTVPQFQNVLHNAIFPLNDCVCKLLRSALADVLQASSGGAVDDIISSTTDADFLMLLNALERLVLLSSSHISTSTQDEDDTSLAEKHESSGLLGYVSNVFGSDATVGAADDQGTVKSSDYRTLHDAVRVLYSIWTTLVVTKGQYWTSESESLSLIYGRTRTRCRRVLEHLFRVHSSGVLESIVVCWSEIPSISKPEDEAATFELVDVLTSSAHNVVHMLCESITIRVQAPQERTRRQLANSQLSDLTLFDFLEEYFRRLEGPLAAQVWVRFIQLAKDVSLSFREYKPQVFSTLQCFTVLADKVTQTTLVEDKRIRKELQETYIKLLDICLLLGRASDTSWIRRSALVNGRDSPVPRDAKLEEKMNASTTSLSDTLKSETLDPLDRINVYIASDVIPNLRKFLVDGDKILTACSSITYGIITPAMRGRSRPLDVDDHVLSILREMTRLAVAIKAWRGPVVDVLNDNRCFNSTPQAGRKWRPMVKMLFDTDKTAFTELLGRITTAPSANIFTNREYEMLLRSLNLRRLSYVILTGDKNHFLTQLPSIQEKLVDTLRNVSAPIVQSEVYLCVRVLLCRLSPHNLSSFWPVVLTEMYRLFEQILVTLPADGSEDLALILSASKLLDLLLVLQTEEFQIHQWIFITDTVDAIYRPDDWSPAALLDRLAEVVGDLPAAEDSKAVDQIPAPTPLVENRPSRRPMLQSVRQIDSIRDLVHFFSHASIASYESVYQSGGNVDWDAVEQTLLEDMFDGR
ncbi:unnamed protein product [Somion occarium]|uniref:Dopey N-terminal domain-containing protein n=1 Tax=Somion occarium TaxID=3059160 RepID=A0ABP1CI46_9APHY